MSEFAKKGNIFESWYNVEMYQLKDKSFIIFFVTFKLCKIYRSEFCQICKAMYTMKMKEGVKMMRFQVLTGFNCSLLKKLHYEKKQEEITYLLYKEGIF